VQVFSSGFFSMFSGPMVAEGMEACRQKLRKI